MKAIFKTIKSKLLLLTIFVTAFYLLLGILSYYFLNKIAAYSKISQPISKFSEIIYGLRRNEKNFIMVDLTNPVFYETGKSTSLDWFNKYNKDAEQLIQQLLTDKFINANHPEYIDKFQIIQKGVISYCNYFNQYVQLVQERGFKSYGLSGEIDKLGNRINSFATTNNDAKLFNQFTEIRKLTSEYLYVREKQINIQVQNTIETYKQQLTENTLHKDSIIHELDRFNNLVKRVLTLDERMGVSINDGIVGEMRLIIGDTEQQSKNLYDQFEQISDKEITNAKTTLVILLIIFAILTSLALIYVSNIINRRIGLIKLYITDLVKGILPERVISKAGDDITAMIDLLNNFVDGLKLKTKFSKEIGQGKLDTEYKAVSEHDILGKSLLEMRESLVTADAERKQRQHEDAIRNWTSQGIAKFSELLRQNNDRLDVLADHVIQNIVHYVNSNQGGLFVLNDEIKEDKHLELIAAYAYDRKKFIQKRIELGDGLVGTCAIEKKLIHTTKIPDNYLEIRSGLGTSNPRCLLIIPLLYNDNVFGIMELASFNNFKPHEIEFIQKIGESIASTIASVKVNVRTSKLLQQSKRQAEELASQEEEMRQNMEELQATQEASAQKEAKMAGLINAIDAATYAIEYDLSGKILKVNHFVEQLLNHTTEEIIGTFHRDYIDSSDAEWDDYDKFWNDLRKGKIKHRISRKNGVTGMLWLNETYTPIYNRDGYIDRILNIAFDITEQKEVEEKNKLLLKEEHANAEMLHRKETELRAKIEELNSIHSQLNDQKRELFEANLKMKENENIISKSLDESKVKEQELQSLANQLALREDELRKIVERLQVSNNDMLNKQKELEQMNDKFKANEIILQEALTKAKEKEWEVKEMSDQIVSSDEEIRQNLDDLQLRFEKQQSIYEKELNELKEENGNLENIYKLKEQSLLRKIEELENKLKV